MCIERKSHFSNWQKARLRTRLLAYYKYQSSRYEANRLRSEGFRKEKTESELDPNPLEVAAKPVSWLTVAEEICHNDSAAEFLDFSTPEDDIVISVDRKPDEANPIDVELDDNENLKGHIDKYWPVKESQLHHFAIGYLIKPKSKRPAYWHFTEPSRDVLNAIAAFLKCHGFISAEELVEPTQGRLIDEVLQLVENGSQTIEKLPEDAPLRGDFLADFAAEQIQQLRVLTCHVHESRAYYSAREVRASLAKSSWYGGLAVVQLTDRGVYSSKKIYHGRSIVVENANYLLLESLSGYDYQIAVYMIGNVQLSADKGNRYFFAKDAFISSVSNMEKTDFLDEFEEKFQSADKLIFSESYEKNLL